MKREPGTGRLRQPRPASGARTPLGPVVWARSFGNIVTTARVSKPEDVRGTLRVFDGIVAATIGPDAVSDLTDTHNPEVTMLLRESIVAALAVMLLPWSLFGQERVRTPRAEVWSMAGEDDDRAVIGIGTSSGGDRDTLGLLITTSRPADRPSRPAWKRGIALPRSTVCGSRYRVPMRASPTCTESSRAALPASSQSKSWRQRRAPRLRRRPVPQRAHQDDRGRGSAEQRKLATSIPRIGRCSASASGRAGASATRSASS